MADVTKFLADDHGRIRRSFHDYRRTPSNLDAALNVCDHLWIHLTIEVELIHPVVWEDLAPGDAQSLSDADDRIYRLMEAIDRMEPKDPALNSLMAALTEAVDGHIGAYERHILPKLRGRSDEMDMGREAFRRWQQLFEERPPRTWMPMNRLANTGWGGGGRFANSGW